MRTTRRRGKLLSPEPDEPDVGGFRPSLLADDEEEKEEAEAEAEAEEEEEENEDDESAKTSESNDSLLL